jgi:hypothetical protein
VRTVDTALKVVSKPRPRAVALGLAMSVAVNNPGGNFLIKKFFLVCKKALVAMAANDPALDVAATTVPVCDKSDDQHGRVIIVDREVVEENRVRAQQNIALAIVAQQNKQQELNAGDINRSLEKQVDELVSDKLHQRSHIQDLENLLANNNADLISCLHEYTDFLEESAEEAAWMVAGLRDEICKLKQSVNFENITSLSTALDMERSRTNHLSTENSGLYDEIYRLHAAINERRINKSCMERNPPTEDLPSGTAGGEETAAGDESWSDDNASLFPSSDNKTH